MKLWILLLCTVAFSSERYENVKNLDVFEPDPPTHYVAKTMKYVLAAGCVIATCQVMYCSFYRQPDVCCRDQSPLLQQNESSVQFVSRCIVCAAAVPVCRWTRIVSKWAYGLVRPSEKELIECKQSYSKDVKTCSLEEFEKCSSASKHELEKCASKLGRDAGDYASTFEKTRKNRLLEIKELEEAKCINLLETGQSGVRYKAVSDSRGNCYRDIERNGRVCGYKAASEMSLTACAATCSKIARYRFNYQEGRDCWCCNDTEALNYAKHGVPDESDDANQKNGATSQEACNSGVGGVNIANFYDVEQCWDADIRSCTFSHKTGNQITNSILKAVASENFPICGPTQTAKVCKEFLIIDNETCKGFFGSVDLMPKINKICEELGEGEFHPDNWSKQSRFYLKKCRELDCNLIGKEE